jgi:hypothetical protein
MLTDMLRNIVSLVFTIGAAALLLTLGCTDGSQPPDDPAAGDSRGWPNDRVSFDLRLESYIDIQRARHQFRKGDKTFEEALEGQDPSKAVRQEVNWIRVLYERFGVRLSEEELDAKLQQFKRRSHNPPELTAIWLALDSDPVKLRYCFAEPGLAMDRLHEIYTNRQDEIQADARRKAERLRQGLTPENFHLRGGDRVSRKTIWRDQRLAQGGEENLSTYTEAQQEAFLKHLQEPGDITPVTEGRAVFQILMLHERDDEKLVVSIIDVPKLTFNGWLQSELDKLPPIDTTPDDAH